MRIHTYEVVGDIFWKWNSQWEGKALECSRVYTWHLRRRSEDAYTYTHAKIYIYICGYILMIHWNEDTQVVTIWEKWYSLRYMFVFDCPEKLMRQRSQLHWCIESHDESCLLRLFGSLESFKRGSSVLPGACPRLSSSIGDTAGIYEFKYA